MKLLMKQRVFSWTDTYDVYDEAGNKKYFVKAELFRLGHQIHVFDVSGNEIGMIKQRLFTLLPSALCTAQNSWSPHAVDDLLPQSYIRHVSVP